MNRDKGILMHMAVYIEDIESFTKEMTYDQFLSDRKTMQAVCYAILNIGELSKDLSDIVRKRNVNIPWKQIKGMRDRVAHGYHFLSPEVVWDVVVYEIPTLKSTIIHELNEVVEKE